MLSIPGCTLVLEVADDSIQSAAEIMSSLLFVVEYSLSHLSVEVLRLPLCSVDIPLLFLGQLRCEDWLYVLSIQFVVLFIAVSRIRQNLFQYFFLEILVIISNRFETIRFGDRVVHVMVKKIYPNFSKVPYRTLNTNQLQIQTVKIQ